MIQVKIFRHGHPPMVQYEINEFLRREDVEFISIHPSEATQSSVEYTYNAILVYKTATPNLGE